MSGASSALFAPFEGLVADLLPYVDAGSDGAHDLSHLVRVWVNAKHIQAAEGGDLELLAASVLLHDCVYVPKNSPERRRASALAAKRAEQVLHSLGWERAKILTVSEAIESHSYSAGLTPRSTEGRILQNADRLDAIGYTGIARCLYTGGKLGSQLYELFDPAGLEREFDDSLFALDHFPKKLLRLAEGFQTETGRRLAQARHEVVLAFYQGILAEIDDSAAPAEGSTASI